MDPCRHPKAAGRTRCKPCHAAYMRWLRAVSEPRNLAAARKEGFQEGLRSVRVLLLEAGDSTLTGFTAAEMVRRLGLD